MGNDVDVIIVEDDNDNSQSRSTSHDNESNNTIPLGMIQSDDDNVIHRTDHGEGHDNKTKLSSSSTPLLPTIGGDNSTFLSSHAPVGDHIDSSTTKTKSSPSVTSRRGSSDSTGQQPDTTNPFGITSFFNHDHHIPLDFLVSDYDTLKQTIHAIMALLQLYGPLTTEQLEYNIPSITPALPTTDATEMNLASIQSNHYNISSTSATSGPNEPFSGQRLAQHENQSTRTLSRETDPSVQSSQWTVSDVVEILMGIGLIQAVEEDDNGIITDPNRRRYCMFHGIPRHEVLYPDEVSEELYKAYDEVRDSYHRCKVLEEALAAKDVVDDEITTTTTTTTITTTAQSVLQGILNQYPDTTLDPVYVTAYRNCHVDLSSIVGNFHASAGRYHHPSENHGQESSHNNIGGNHKSSSRVHNHHHNSKKGKKKRKMENTIVASPSSLSQPPIVVDHHHSLPKQSIGNIAAEETVVVAVPAVPIEPCRLMTTAVAAAMDRGTTVPTAISSTTTTMIAPSGNGRIDDIE